MSAAEQTRSPGEPVTVVVSRRVRTDAHQEFLSWADEAVAHAAARPGFLGGSVLRPGRDDGDHHLVYRFESLETLAAWEESRERAELLARLSPLVLADRAQKVTGLETWFSLPDRPGLPAPPRWKMALLTLLAVLPMQLAFAVWVGPHLGDVVLRSAVLALTLVTLMTWVVMPRFTRWTRRWLYPAQTAD